MTIELTPVIVALIAAAAAALGSLLTAYGARKRWPTEKATEEAKQAASEASAAAELIKAASEFIDDLRAEQGELRERVQKLEMKDRESAEIIHQQANRIDQLISELLWAKQQIRKLEENNKLRQDEIRRLRQILREAGIPNGD